ncbi:glycosyltransferase family A protein [Stygiolobus caldivivus]|uniref:Glycosyltransferase 2-like domain-containing protein n=1 Tax=Stygiolobus caldivivus TaxID=2824673 RepID=A0A8D5ZH38_9CREN|nr:glycosyltransferase family A protein [Stygiolobus caldivivus]BCU69359.1 hypothetical protein KN1_06560 [Stygiolobus caldivivus]
MGKATVGIPSLLRKSLHKTLRALIEQSEDDFDVLITYRGNLTREFEKYEKQLSIRFIEQDTGLFEEALNLILSNARGKILLTTDDDAMPAKNWVLEHTEFHENNKDVGIVTGEVEGRMWTNYPNFLYEKLKGTKFMEEYSHSFKEYKAYLTKTGFSVDRETGYGKSIAIAGVNMSMKKEVYSNSRVLTYSLRGSYNESFLAVNSIKLGYSSMKAKIAKVVHLDNDSLSRPIKDDMALRIEKFTSPYMFNYIFPIDLDLLKELHSIVTEEEEKIGIGLAIEGIEDKLPPEKFRERLKEEVEGRNMHHN